MNKLVFHVRKLKNKLTQLDTSKVFHAFHSPQRNVGSKNVDHVYAVDSNKICTSSHFNVVKRNLTGYQSTGTQQPA